MKNTRNNPKNNSKNNPKRQRSAHNRPDKPSSKSKAKLPITIFGTHAVTAAWLNPARRINALYITEKMLESFGDTLKQAERLKLDRPAPTIIDKSALDHALPQAATHQGIALDAVSLEEVDIDDIIRATTPQERSLILMLDQVTDPHNVGAILRSACAFGADALVMQRKHAPALTGVLAKTACGGVEHVDVAYETNLSRAIESLQAAGYHVIGLAEEGEALEQGLSSQNNKIVLVLGAEGDGLRRLVREHCDSLVRLPTKGAISSLNVSNAAAVALFALAN